MSLPSNLHTPSELGASRRLGLQEDRLSILFTDIVRSTERLVELGNAQWYDLLLRHHQAVRLEVCRHRGHLQNSTGDGFVATFTTAIRGIECARAIRDSTLALGIEIRAGLHVGECSNVAGVLAGLAVHTAARIVAMAAANEILISRTVRDLVAIPDVALVRRGAYALRGIPGRWELFAIA